MSLKKKYKCVNIGGCKYASEKKVFEIPVGEDLICPSCKKNMIVEVPASPLKKILIICGSVVVLALVVFFVVKGVGSSPKAPEGTGVASTDSLVVDETSQVDNQQQSIDSVRVVEDQSQTEVEKSEDNTTETTTSTVNNSNVKKTINLGYGVYTGKVKNGKPHDTEGRITYKSAHQIESRDVKKRIAQPGDYVIGNFENGHLVSGKWFKSDGNTESLIIG